MRIDGIERIEGCESLLIFGNCYRIIVVGVRCWRCAGDVLEQGGDVFW